MFPFIRNIILDILLLGFIWILVMKSYKEMAENYGISYANSMFDDFIKYPEYKGPVFKWDTFPGLVARLAKVSLFMSYRSRPKKLDQLKEICYNKCFERATELVKENGLM